MNRPIGARNLYHVLNNSLNQLKLERRASLKFLSTASEPSSENLYIGYQNF